MPRILGLDVGKKRIGVAVSDPLNITAQGLDTINRKDTKTVLDKIHALIKEYDAEKIVVGLPINMDGSKGNSAELVEEFTALLKKDISIEIELLDERLTTAQGERILLEADVSRKRRKLVADKIAAQLILQTYLDSNKA